MLEPASTVHGRYEIIAPEKEMRSLLQKFLRHCLTKQKGATLFEQIIVLALAAISIGGVTAIIESMETNFQERDTAIYQTKMAQVAAQIINNKIGLSPGDGSQSNGNYLIYSLDYIQNTFGLGRNLSAQNSYSQTPCLLIRKFPPPNDANNLSSLSIRAILFTEGGNPISDDSLMRITGLSTVQTGYISNSTDSASPDTPPHIVKFGLGTDTSNEIDLNDFKMSPQDDSINTCTGNPLSAAGHLVTPIYWDGNKMTANYLYRAALTSDTGPRSKLNQMETDLDMGNHKITNVTSLGTDYVNINKAAKGTLGGDCTDTQSDTETEVITDYLGKHYRQPIDRNHAISIDKDNPTNILICKNGKWTGIIDSPPMAGFTTHSCTTTGPYRGCDAYCSDNEELVAAYAWCVHGYDQGNEKFIYDSSVDHRGQFWNLPSDFYDVKNGQNSTKTSATGQTDEGYSSRCFDMYHMRLVVWCRPKAVLP